MNVNRGSMAMRRYALAVVCALLLAGCGSGSSEPGATPTPSEPLRVYTLDELQAALPGVEDVPTGSKRSYACPGDKGCEDGTVSVNINMLPPIGAADAERVEKKSDISDSTYVSARATDDATAAEAQIDGDRKDAQQFVGDFDVEPQDLGDDSFIPGERGSGTVEEVSVAGWEGIDATRTSTWVAPEGFGAFEEDGEVDTTELIVSGGTVVLRVQITLRVQYREAGTASAIARQVAEQYIARLGDAAI